MDYVSSLVMRLRLDALESQVAEAARQAPGSDLRAIAAEKLARGAALTREELAAHLDVSMKKIQRMDAAGTLKRCPNLGSVVRYAARDVLRLASAS